MLLSFERPIAGASVFPTPGAMLRHFIGLVPAVLPESTEHVQQTIGILQELGRSCRFLSEIPAGEPGYQLQALAAHSSARERT